MEFAFLLTRETNGTLKNQESNREKVNFLPEQNLTFPKKNRNKKNHQHIYKSLNYVYRLVENNRSIHEKSNLNEKIFREKKIINAVGTDPIILTVEH